MPKFEFFAEVTVSAYTTVEADTLEAARKIADERSVGHRLEHPYSTTPEREHWIVFEIDGEPTNVRQTKEE